jgi:26S proteasome regulatory subunit N8
LPNLKVDQVVKNFSVKTNDYMHVVYISTLIRSVISLHNLINNKIATKEIETDNAKREEEIRKKKEEETRKKVEDALKKAEEADNGDVPREEPK